MRWPRFNRSCARTLAAGAALALVVFGVWLMLRTGRPPVADQPGIELPLGTNSHPASIVSAEAEPQATGPAGPPWRYGRANARFTVTEYADLECPFCRAYFPVMKRWIDTHPDVAWQWHHLPLPMHEPAASVEARLAECMGRHGGQAAFWRAVEWVYAHTRGDGQGLPADLHYPGMTPEVERCQASDQSEAAVRAQADDATRQEITVTPTLRLEDGRSRKTLLLRGPVDGDVLLSAIDLVAAGDAAAQPSKEMPAESLGDTPR